MDVIQWIEEHLAPQPCTSGTFLYDHMASQSGRSLPIIYQPFDVTDRRHWLDRGAVFDFVHTAGRGKLLDFGPGDGWPSLILAPYVDQVIGVEGSQRRVEVCRENAARLGIDNATFIYVEPGTPLPFEADSFDGITAASSVEQTPDPYATLQELYRVLKPVGRLRLSYEGLECYRDRSEFEAWLLSLGQDTCRLVIYDRDIDGERVQHYGLTLSMSEQDAAAILMPADQELDRDTLTVDLLERIRPSVVQALKMTLRHPSNKTWVAWMKKCGFSAAETTHCGQAFAWLLFGALSPEKHPPDRAALDALLDPAVQVVVQLAARPIRGRDPYITATK